MSYLDALPKRYRLILCDIWGVVHDGVTLFPGAADRLRQWRSEGRCAVLITNAPRTTTRSGLRQWINTSRSARLSSSSR